MTSTAHSSSPLNAPPTAIAPPESTSARAEVLLDGAESMLRRELAAEAVELTIVIPVFNEPITVLEIVHRVRALPISKQIVVVNDGSTDATATSLQQLSNLADVTVLHHDVNRGKGAALQTGFQQARGRFVIVQDADLEYDPSDILRVIAPLQRGESDVVYGSRYLDNAQQDPSAVHRFGNWALTSFSNLLTGHRLTDMETCYKAFRREVLQRIHIEQNRFGFEPEITAKLAKQQVQIREVGISYACRSRAEGKKIGWRDLLNALVCIVRYRR
ncbi:MAG: glycosyltransferase family 2 protein [Planctomycetales bacterium]|nr:glycosyltransferase family 2 protein [Planctomycetales bacterium]